MKKIIVLIILVLLCGCTKYDPIDSSINNINNAKKVSDQKTAELIAKEVQLAYTSYLFEMNGEAKADSDSCEYMTTDYFSMDNLKTISCSSGTSTITLNNDAEYTAVYDDGEMTISGAEKDIKIKIGR